MEKKWCSRNLSLLPQAFFHCLPSRHVNYFFIIYLEKSAAEGRQNCRHLVIEFDIKSSFMFLYKIRNVLLRTPERTKQTTEHCRWVDSEFESDSGHRGYGESTAVWDQSLPFKQLEIDNDGEIPFLHLNTLIKLCWIPCCFVSFLNPNLRWHNSCTDFSLISPNRFVSLWRAMMRHFQPSFIGQSWHLKSNKAPRGLLNSMMHHLDALFFSLSKCFNMFCDTKATVMKHRKKNSHAARFLKVFSPLNDESEK